MEGELVLSAAATPVFITGFNPESLYSLECIWGSGSTMTEGMKFEDVQGVIQIGRKSGPPGKATVPPELAASPEDRGSGVIVSKQQFSEVTFLVQNR